MNSNGTSRAPWSSNHPPASNSTFNRLKAEAMTGPDGRALPEEQRTGDGWKTRRWSGKSWKCLGLSGGRITLTGPGAGAGDLRRSRELHQLINQHACPNTKGLGRISRAEKVAAPASIRRRRASEPTPHARFAIIGGSEVAAARSTKPTSTALPVRRPRPAGAKGNCLARAGPARVLLRTPSRAAGRRLVMTIASTGQRTSWPGHRVRDSSHPITGSSSDTARRPTFPAIASPDGVLRDGDAGDGYRSRSSGLAPPRSDLFRIARPIRRARLRAGDRPAVPGLRFGASRRSAQRTAWTWYSTTAWRGSTKSVSRAATTGRRSGSAASSSAR